MNSCKNGFITGGQQLFMVRVMVPVFETHGGTLESVAWNWKLSPPRYPVNGV